MHLCKMSQWPLPSETEPDMFQCETATKENTAEKNCVWEFWFLTQPFKLLSLTFIALMLNNQWSYCSDLTAVRLVAPADDNHLVLPTNSCFDHKLSLRGEMLLTEKGFRTRSN